MGFRKATNAMPADQVKSALYNLCGKTKPTLTGTCVGNLYIYS
jgi:hypothetical protein